MGHTDLYIYIYIPEDIDIYTKGNVGEGVYMYCFLFCNIFSSWDVIFGMVAELFIEGSTAHTIYQTFAYVLSR